MRHLLRTLPWKCINPDLRVIATYRDGHTEVDGWYTDMVPIILAFELTVFYQSVFDKITVTILDEGRIQCSYCGLEYIFSESPYGCPTCYYTVIAIEAGLRNGGNKVLYKSQLNLEIILIFRDTHREVTYTGYGVSGYEPDVLGFQTITVSYQEFTTTLTIEVIDNPNLVICPNGHAYYLNSDGTDPGCPTCAASEGRADAIYYFDITYTNAIIETLYEDGIFYMKQGDYFTVKVTVRNQSLRYRIQEMFTGHIREKDRRSYTFGGEVIPL